MNLKFTTNLISSGYKFDKINKVKLLNYFNIKAKLSSNIEEAYYSLYGITHYA